MSLSIIRLEPGRWKWMETC